MSRCNQRYSLNEVLLIISMLNVDLSEQEVATLTGRSTFGIRKKLTRAGLRKTEHTANRLKPIKLSSPERLYSYFGEELPKDGNLEKDIVRRINSFIKDLERFKQNELDYNL